MVEEHTPRFMELFVVHCEEEPCMKEERQTGVQSKHKPSDLVHIRTLHLVYIKPVKGLEHRNSMMEFVS